MDNAIKLSLQVMDVMREETRRTSVVLDGSASVAELLRTADCQNADFSKYYPFSGPMCFQEETLPYIIRGSRIRYDVPFEQAGVSDLMRTLDLSDGKLELTAGYPMAGGPGLVSLAQMWESARPILEGIAVFCSLTGVSAAALIQWFCALFRKRRRTPQVCFDIIYSRAAWNHHELASLMAIEPDRAKGLLRVFGYTYDRSKRLYVQSDKVEEIRSKLTDVKSLDV